MSDEFDRLVGIIKRLRAPNGCPWDRKQTLYSLKQNVMEEVFEFIDALDRKDIENIKEELGDMLLHIVFHSTIAEEEELFSLRDVINTISSKLIRRHPHVFGNVKVNDINDVLKNWDEIKQKEKHTKLKHYLDDVPKSLPAIERALKIQQKVSKVGFDWHNKKECFKKVEEEFEELKEAFEKNDRESMEQEMGDLMFTLINLSRFIDINPSEALRKTSLRFENRFNCMEDDLKKDNIHLRSATINDMEERWQKCKGMEKKTISNNKQHSSQL